MGEEKKMVVKQLRPIYQLKVTLSDARPPIWRRLLVPGNINLGSFHVVLQIVMGWSDSHLHQFISGKTLYGFPEDDFGDVFGLELENENKYKLSQLLRKEKDFLKYEYDFGDGWEHKITLEKILPYKSSMKLPCCIKGKRACPPEDCGGIWGYQDLIKAINDTSHPEHEEMLEWLGEDFDPEYFDANSINEVLSKYTK